MPAAPDRPDGAGDQARDEPGERNAAAGCAVDMLLALDATDDAGAETAARYEWQAAMAAADALSMLAEHLRSGTQGPPDDNVFLVCELHEDWIACAAGEAQLVSAKHREAAHSTVTTLTSLVDDLGVGHLFSRWHQAGRQPSARLVTTAALTTTCGDVVDLCGVLAAGTACTPEQDKLLEGLGRELMFRGKDLPDRWRRDPTATQAAQCRLDAEHLDDVRTFCARFTVQQAQPRRQFVAALAANTYAAPAVRLAGGDPTSAAEAVWQAVLVVVRRAMQAGGEAPLGALPQVPGGIRRTRRTELEARTIGLAAVWVAVQQAMAHPAAFVPLPPRTARVSRLQVKMRRGGCTGTNIGRAEALRSDYLAYVEAKRTGAPLKDVRTRLLARNLHRIADETVQELSAGTAVWGRRLWRDLPERLAAWDDDERPPGLRPDVALGGVADLIEHCQVWLSEDESDVEAEVRLARTAAP